MNRGTALLLILLSGSLSACAWTSKLKFWDSGPQIEPGAVELRELRRALVCGTPSEAAAVRFFDSAEALTQWDVDNTLQLGRIELPADQDFVLIEQGKRDTGGYSLELRGRGQVDEEGVLTLTGEWLEPAADRIVTQIITSLCVLVAVEPAAYTRVVLNDKNGTFRAATDIERD